MVGGRKILFGGALFLSLCIGLLAVLLQREEELQPSAQLEDAQPATPQQNLPAADEPEASTSGPEQDTRAQAAAAAAAALRIL